MKISKSKLQKIIHEEVQNIIQEGWFDDLKSSSFARGAGRLGAAALRGAMGTGAETDNPISRGIHGAWGATLVPKIDKLFNDLAAALDALDGHTEGDKIKNAATTPTTPTSGVAPPPAPGNPQIIRKLRDSINSGAVAEWMAMTQHMRQGAPGPGPTPPGPGPTP